MPIIPIPSSGSGGLTNTAIVPVTVTTTLVNLSGSSGFGVAYFSLYNNATFSITITGDANGHTSINPGVTYLLAADSATTSYSMVLVTPALDPSFPYSGTVIIVGLNG